MTSKAEQLYLALKAKHPEAMQSVSELSRNSSDGRDFIRSSYQAFNFDKVDNVCPAKIAKEKSPDALFLHSDTLYFVEFKEGSVSKEDIRMKIHEAVVTLFHFAVENSVLTRDEFLELEIKYAVVMRNQTKGRPNPSILDTIESRSTYFNLKNIEGLLVQETKVAFLPQTIAKLLHKLSNGKVAPAHLVHEDQVTLTAI